LPPLVNHYVLSVLSDEDFLRISLETNTIITRLADDSDMFNGAPDHYDLSYKGLQEFYIPYNSYKLSEKGASYKALVKPFHLNPDYMRCELHRVHVISHQVFP
jgi:hypothetical protein